MISLTPGRSDGEPLDILCLGAHSDDIEIGCGATVLRLLAERPSCRVYWVVLSASPERESEARSSAAAFLTDAGAAEVMVRSFRESYFPSESAGLKDAFEELKATIDPDVVFSHHRSDRHQDHRTVAELTWNTFRDHWILQYEIPKYEGDLGHPNIYVPVSHATAHAKAAMLLEQFGTQIHRPWFRESTFLGLMAIRGVECNAPDGYAEAFHAEKSVL